MVMNMSKKYLHLQGIALLALALTLPALTACKATKKIRVDGSSTVYPITEAVAEQYRTVDRNVNVAVGTSGTGGGFKKFCNNETDISDASRPIKKKEVEKCSAAGIEYSELPVAYDGIAVVVHKKNSFLKQLTVEQLNKIFRYDNPAKTWKDVDPSWPAEEIKAFAPGQDSGTYDYFVETIIAKKGRVRADATFSEDDNVLVTGISGEEQSIGFFGLAYYEENQDKLRIIPVVNPKSGQAVEPSLKTVKNGAYAPLSRPLFLYVRAKAATDPQVKKFVEFYLDHAAELSKEVGYVPLGEDLYGVVKKRFADGVTGSELYGKEVEGKSLLQIYKH